jgi:hypothetical protein
MSYRLRTLYDEIKSKSISYDEYKSTIINSNISTTTQEFWVKMDNNELD